MTMSKLPSLATYEYTVTMYGPDGVASTHTVEASYYQEAGAFTQLKDDGHMVVDAFRTDTVLRITRSDEPLDDD